MNFFRSRRRLLVVMLGVLGALFIFRPGANGLRKRIAHSVGLALGRSVEIGRVTLHVLPQPGFDLENFVVHDDPAFGAEPMLRAPSVTAALRLRSLMHGRLEIGRLSLSEPSFNLVRGPEGHWNLEALLDRVAHTAAAPTRNVKPEARPVFPYIEADNGRINFKIGPEKKAYALTDADFALWLESDNEWGMRLAAQPVRTDFNLNNTGIVRVSGTWERAGSLRQTPLAFKLQWDGAQLGQFTKMVYGNDKGWRGTLSLEIRFSGVPADLNVSADASVQDFRRYDIVSTDPLRLSSHCTALYTSVEHVLSRIDCRAPVGQGLVTLAGRITAPTGPRAYDLSLVAQDVPVRSLLALARRAKKDLPADLTASGDVNATLSLRTRGTPGATYLDWDGGGDTADFRLHSDSTKTELALGKIPFALAPADANQDVTVGRAASPAFPAETRLSIGPFTLSEAKSSPTVCGWVGRSGYEVSIIGDSKIPRLLQVAETFGLRVLQPPADGSAKIDLLIAGQWTGFTAPRLTGTAQLRGVEADLHGLNQPLEIASAAVQFSDGQVRVHDIFASIGRTHWTGWLSFPRPCASPAACPVSLGLNADTVSAAELSDLLNPGLHSTPWYRFLSRTSHPSTLAGISAHGKITVGRFLVGSLAVNRVAADFNLHEGRLRLSDLHGDLLGGRHHGELDADFRVSPPAYSGSGTLDRVSLADLADAMHDNWITGTANANYQLSCSGFTASELLSSATGRVHFEAGNGLLPHITLSGTATPLHLRHFAGRMDLRERQFELQEAKLDAPGGIYQVTGTATFSKKIDLKFMRGTARGFDVTGTLSEPRVLPVANAEARAALKP